METPEPDTQRRIEIETLQLLIESMLIVGGPVLMRMTTEEFERASAARISSLLHLSTQESTWQHRAAHLEWQLEKLKWLQGRRDPQDAPQPPW